MTTLDASQAGSTAVGAEYLRLVPALLLEVRDRKFVHDLGSSCLLRRRSPCHHDGTIIHPDLCERSLRACLELRPHLFSPLVITNFPLLANEKIVSSLRVHVTAISDDLTSTTSSLYAGVSGSSHSVVDISLLWRRSGLVGGLSSPTTKNRVSPTRTCADCTCCELRMQFSWRENERTAQKRKKKKKKKRSPMFSGQCALPVGL